MLDVQVAAVLVAAGVGGPALLGPALDERKPDLSWPDQRRELPAHDPVGADAALLAFEVGVVPLPGHAKLQNFLCEALQGRIVSNLIKLLNWTTS